MERERARLMNEILEAFDNNFPIKLRTRQVIEMNGALAFGTVIDDELRRKH